MIRKRLVNRRQNTVSPRRHVFRSDMFQTFKSFNTFKLFNKPIRSDGLNDLNGLNYLNRLRAAFYASP